MGVRVRRLASCLRRATIRATMTERSRFDPIRPASYFRAGESLKTAMEKHDPFWGPQLIVLAAIVLDLSLPEKLTLGPTWLLPSLEGLLLLALLIASPHPRMRHSPLRRKLAMTLIALRQPRQRQLARAADPLPAAPQRGPGRGSAADPRRHRAVGHQRAAVRALVLGARPRRPDRPGDPARRHCQTSCSRR